MSISHYKLGFKFTGCYFSAARNAGED